MVSRLLLVAALAFAVSGCGADGADSRPRAEGATAAAAPRPATAAPRFALDWPMFGRTTGRTSASDAAVGVSAADAPRLRRTTVALPGVVDNAPIFLHDVPAGGRSRDLFVVTTTYGRAVAVDARSAQIVWTFTPQGYDSWAGSDQIMSASPAASADRRFVFSGAPDGRVHKLAVADGSEQGGGWPVTITTLPSREKVSPSFGLIGGRLVVGAGGYVGGKKPYQGHLVTIDPDSGAVGSVFNVLCSDRRELLDPTRCPLSGGAFFSRSGAVALADGSLILATGDGRWDGRRNFGDSVLRLSADGSRILGSWTPANQRALDDGDIDLGASGPVPIGGGSIVQGGKDGRLHVFAASALTHVGSLGKERQNIPAPGDGPMFTAPAVWTRNGRTLLFAATMGGTAGYEQRGGRLVRRWSKPTAGTSPIVAGGLLWVYDPTGGLNAYRPASGARVAHLPAGRGHFNSPVPGTGVIAVGQGDANQHRTEGVLNLYAP